MNSKIKIYYETTHVGDIQTVGPKEITFQYSEEWLSYSRTFPLSALMPLQSKPIEGDTIVKWFSNILPEGENYEGISRYLRVTDVFDILVTIGGDNVGALSISAKDKASAWKYRKLVDHYHSIEESDALEQHFSTLPTRPFLVGEKGVRLSLAGGQIKTVLAVLDETGNPVLRVPKKSDCLSIPMHGAPSTVIIKPNNPKLDCDVENEVFCLRLSKSLGIPTAECTVLCSKTRKAVCILRYDRQISESGQITRTHQEDFAQMSNVFPFQKYEVAGRSEGPSIKRLYENVEHFSATDKLDFIDRLIFNILISNSDAHAKNYSAIISGANSITLAPMYDAMTTLIWQKDLNQKFAQRIAGKTREPKSVKGEHWDHIANELGLGKVQLRARVKELAGKIGEKMYEVLEEVCQLDGVDAGCVDKVAKQVGANAQRLAGRI